MPPFCLLCSRKRSRKSEQITATAASSCQHNHKPTPFMKGIRCKTAPGARRHAAEHGSRHSPGHGTAQELTGMTENSSSWL